MKFPLQGFGSWLRQCAFAVVCLLALSDRTIADSLIPVGAARVDISPTRPVPLMGYAARAKLPAPTEVAQPIHARALAIGAGQDAALILTVDNCILPGAITEEVRRRMGDKLHILPERIALSVTHTHSAPCLSGAAPNIFGADIAAPDQVEIDAYTQFLIDRLEQVALAALADRKPAVLSWGEGNVGFAKNRRTQGGPVDHHMPLLRVTTPEGQLRAVYVSYACHCTTLGGDFNAVHGDWAGVAAQAVERDHPAAVAMVAIGCGADSNPDPRGTLDLAVQHGEEIASETNRLLAGQLSPLTDAPECQIKTIQLPFQTHFTREEWQRRAATPGVVGFHARKWLARMDRGEEVPASIPYPVQTWRFGDKLAMVFLGGEVVVDYSLRLKRELDTQRLWVNAYSNDVPCYIPSRRVLSEGGYEAETSLWYYDRPQRLAPEAEDLIVQTVHELLPKSFAAPPQNTLPPPKTPAEALRMFRPRNGFNVELVASEPLIESPVAIDFGADGRLWVCEMRDYPSGIDGAGKPGGCIKALSDTDQDGRYDTAEIWADDLPFPTGLMAWRNGVLVCAAPDIWFISPDEEAAAVKSSVPSNAKRVATRRVKLLSGFATGNFQARVNGLRLGLDGWIYGSGGLFGGKITVCKTGQTIDCTNRDFRFRPDTGEFEPLAGVSQQGHVRDDFDQWFGNDNSTLLWHFPMPDRYRRRNPHVTMPAARVAPVRDAEPAQVFPVSQVLERFNHPESANRITSGCGPEIYRDELIGREFAGNAFACETVHNLVRRAVLEPKGVTFAAYRAEDEQRSEFLTSTDNWFRPVEVRTGPDGALWIVDMYRFVIEHPRWIPAERLKELDVRAGADKGRIWRVFPVGTTRSRVRDLTKLSPAELAATIDSTNGPTRDIAQRLLMDLPRETLIREAVTELVRIAGQPGRAASRAQAAAILRECDRLDEQLLIALLSDPDPRLRRFAVMLCEPQFGAENANASDALLALVNDPDPSVRYQLALTLGEFRHDDAAGRTLAQIAARDGASEWHRAAVLSSILASPKAFVGGFAREGDNIPGLEALRSGVLTSLVSTGNAEALAEWIGTRFPSQAGQFSGSQSAEALQVLGALSAKPEIEAQIERSANSGVSTVLKRLRSQLEGSAVQLVLDSNSPAETRTAALRLLGERARTDDVRRAELLGLVEKPLPDALRQTFAEVLQRQEGNQVATVLLKHWSERSPSQRLMLLPILLSRLQWTNGLLAEIEQGRVAAAELSPAQRQQLCSHQDLTLRARAEKLFAATASDRGAVIKRFAGVAALTGNVARGGEQFERLCSSCHALKGRGHSVGPDLAGFRAKPVEDFLTAILDPNAAIEPHYAMWTAEVKDGRVLAGVAQDESTTALTLVQPGGLRTVVQRADIVRFSPMSVSLMPVGLEEGLKPQDLADLIAWIKTVPARFGSATPGAADVAKQTFLAGNPAGVAELASSHEPLPYPSWLGRLPLFYCRQTDGQSHVTWKAAHPDSNRFRFAAAMGYLSDPAGNFVLRVNGKEQLTFAVTLDDAEWTSSDSRVRARYTVYERNTEDSCGVLEVELAPSLTQPGAAVTFEVTGTAARSQRWFGVYQVR
ncbi:neutral/alkaline non-lysosomal ceramidase N-terminal domain-containing protein [Verrucomicrobiota bacterium sgz303538]